MRSFFKLNEIPGLADGGMGFDSMLTSYKHGEIPAMVGCSREKDEEVEGRFRGGGTGLEAVEDVRPEIIPQFHVFDRVVRVLQAHTEHFVLNKVEPAHD